LNPQDVVLRRSFSADAAAVRALYEGFLEGWNRSDASALASVFAENGDLVAFDGTHLKGRRKIAEYHRPLLETRLRGTRLVGRVTSLRLLDTDVVLLHALCGIAKRGRSSTSPELDCVQTLVADKRNGLWCVAALHTTCARPIAGGRRLGSFLGRLRPVLRRRKSARLPPGSP